MLRKNIAVQIIAGVVLVLVGLTVFVCVTGYREFTSAVATQYKDCAFNTARTARTLIPHELLTGEIAGPEFRMRFKMLEDEWSRLADTQDATFIYVIRPDKSDYNHIKFFLSVMNSSANYDRYPSGYVRQTTNDEYRRGYKEICENGSQIVTIFRDKGDSETGHHITVMIPVKLNDSSPVDWILCVQRQMERLNFYRTSYVDHVATVAAVIVLAVFAVYALYLNKVLIRPVQKIAAETERFARENTKSESPLSMGITTVNEIGRLAKTIDAMESDVLNYIESIKRITSEKEQIKAELNIASKIQLDMLPKIVPPFSDNKCYDISATMTPAKDVGGDFYDFFMIDDNHLAMVMADVSGKGIPAALFMARANAVIRTRSQMGGTPSEILNDVNNQLCEGNEAELFVTVWLGILELSTGTVTASNAGHEYPAIYRPGEGYTLFKTKQSPAVATMEGLRFRPSEFTLNPGDNLYLYTDGVAEATNSNNELYGTDRMIEGLNGTVDMPVEDILKTMKKSVDDFTGDAPQFDDITMLSLKYYGRRE